MATKTVADEKPSPPAPSKPKTTIFGGCFRLGSKKSNKIGNSNSSWLCWKKAVATKTVPLVDEETKSKHVRFELVPAAVTDVLEDPGLPIPIASDHKPSELTASDVIQKTGSDSSKDHASQKRRLSFRRKVESIRTAAAGSSQPGSPVVQLQEISVAVISPSATRDVTPRRATRRRGGGESPSSSTTRIPWGLVSNENWTTSSTMTSKRLDPLMGMTIIMVTLVIMVLWGRLCAILCTAAWFYLLPRLTHHHNKNSNYSTTAGNSFPHPRDDNRSDFMSSDEYKKKVILEGFLERNNHRSHLQQ